MLNLWKKIQKKNQYMEHPDIYYLSMHIDRENQEHVDKLNLFIKMLNEQNIEWKTYISEPALMTIHNNIYNHFNVCVEMKYKDVLHQIHNDVYGFDLINNGGK